MNRLFQRWMMLCCAGSAAALLGATAFAAPPLTTLEYKVIGSRLEVSPTVLSVPKNIAGSISVQLSAGATAPAGSFIEATLRGPSFPARRLVGAVGSPFLLPPRARLDPMGNGANL